MLGTELALLLALINVLFYFRIIPFDETFRTTFLLYVSQQFCLSDSHPSLVRDDLTNIFSDIVTIAFDPNPP